MHKEKKEKKNREEKKDGTYMNKILPVCDVVFFDQIN
jgi:hypothetical protein